MAEPIRFVQTSAGIVVDEFPTHVDISRGYLEQADPAVVQRDGNQIIITVTNGQALYEIVSWDSQMLIARCCKIGLTRKPGGPPLPKHPLPQQRGH